MKPLFGLLLATLAMAQTRVTGTMGLPTSGDLVNGSCTYQALDGNTSTAQVVGVPVTVDFGQPKFARGHLEVDLIPTDVQQPDGQYYKVACTAPAQNVNGHQTQLFKWNWTWLVPTSPNTTTVGAVRIPTAPSPGFTVTWPQIFGQDLAPGQLKIWDGHGWVPSYPSQSSQAGMTDPGGPGLPFRTTINATRLSTYSDLVGLWNSGTCSGYLRSNGLCDTPSGGLQNAAVMYVSTTGNDTNSGNSWQASKATVAGAIAALPVTSSGVTAHYGTVYVGPGTFTEVVTPIEFNSNIALMCTVAGDGGINSSAGTVIKLGNSRNTALLAPTSAYVAGNGYAHFLKAENCTFDGNVANNPTAPPMIQVYNGGFQNVFNHIQFQNTKDYALKVSRQAVSFACDHCTWSSNGGAFYLDSTAGGNSVSIYDSQIDNSGQYPIYINHKDDGGSNVLRITNLKTEATTGTTTHQNVIRFSPPTSGGHPFAIQIAGLTATSTLNPGSYAVYEENNPGYGANWNISASQAAGYTGVFQSAKNGHTSGYEVVQLSAGDTVNTYDRSPVLEMSGGAGIYAGNGDPEGAVIAKVGSTYHRLDGGTATLYTKQTGTGNTGWIAAGTGTGASGSNTWGGLLGAGTTWGNLIGQ